ncbi:ATP-binding protein [Streptomyces sp. YU58]|uniref:ATP-binding protein n=1 Tax=Streptomyces sp. SX92 TaxID=3158972 RepID=UPI0027BA2E09|nr:ATP-binding protein [Streptomyces coralus]WLW49847.1 ATP-binding protein [Streptomyces coralus]
MSSPANHVLRQPHRAVSGTGGAATTGALPPPERPADPGERSASRSAPPTEGAGAAALRISCSGEGFALARDFTRDTLRRWSLDHCGDDAALVITELAANAVAHGVPGSASGEEGVWLGILLDSAHVLLTVSDPGDDPPACTVTGDPALREHGRGLIIVDALAEEWGWTLKPPAGKTVWARLSTCPPS